MIIMFHFIIGAFFLGFFLGKLSSEKQTQQIEKQWKFEPDQRTKEYISWLDESRTKLN